MAESSGGKKVSIRDVAGAAGVSVTTVSNALNGKGRLTESTRAHVRETAIRLGYRASLSAQKLAGGKTGLLGLIVARQGAGSLATITQTTYFVELLAAASTAALAHGYALVLSTGTAEGTDEPWQQAPLDGAVVVDPIAHDPTVTYLQANHTPVVTTGRVPDTDSGPLWVDNDHVAATREALEHLESNGATRIALITAALRTSYAVDVDQTYADWCSERGCTPMREVVSSDLGESVGFEAASRLLQQPDPPDAILAIFERLAPGAALAASTLGFRVPEDVLISGYADSAASIGCRPELTALALHPDRIGAEAVKALVRLIEGPRSEENTWVESELMIRDSTQRDASPVVSRMSAEKEI